MGPDGACRIATRAGWPGQAATRLGVPAARRPGPGSCGSAREPRPPGSHRGGRSPRPAPPGASPEATPPERPLRIGRRPLLFPSLPSGDSGARDARGSPSPASTLSQPSTLRSPSSGIGFSRRAKRSLWVCRVPARLQVAGCGSSASATARSPGGEGGRRPARAERTMPSRS